jgi:YbbR domain-containing protein
LPETKKSSPRISPKKLSNLKVVVLCIAAATTFWILNALNKDDYTTVVDFPIELVYDRERYVSVAEEPENIQIEISGNGWDLLRKYFNFNSQNFPVEVSNPASRDFILTSDLKRGLSDFLGPTQVVSILDDSIKYHINRIQTIKITPKLDSTSFSLYKNFKLLGTPEFEPSQLTFTGPSSLLDSLKKTFTVNLNENKINKDLSKEVKLNLPKEMASLVSIKEKTVTVKLDVVAFLEGNKRLKIKKLNFPRSVTLENENEPLMMDYLVDERSSDQLKELEFEGVVDYYKRNKEDSTITVEVKPLPSFLDQVRVTPPKLKLRYGN